MRPPYFNSSQALLFRPVEKSLSADVQKFLLTHANAKWGSINGAGEFMAILHRRLCPGLPITSDRNWSQMLTKQMKELIT